MEWRSKGRGEEREGGGEWEGGWETAVMTLARLHVFGCTLNVCRLCSTDFYLSSFKGEGSRPPLALHVDVQRGSDSLLKGIEFFSRGKHVPASSGLYILHV